MATNDNKAEVIIPPNTLQLKVGTSGGGKVAIDPDAIRRAETAMENLRVEFSDWLADDINNLYTAYSNFAKDDKSENAAALFRSAHDLKGQAATFEYPLIARAAASLAKLIDGVPGWDATSKALVAAHVDAIRVIHRDKIKDISNLVALTLTEELEGRVIKALAKSSQS